MRPTPELPGNLLCNSRVVPSRKHIVQNIPKGLVWAEVGVALGGFSNFILDTSSPSKFYAVDLFNLHKLKTLWGKPTMELFGGKTHRQFYEDTFRAELEQNILDVCCGDSSEILYGFPDKSLDVIYLDADHTYEGVKRDLEALRLKVRDNGYLILNDLYFSGKCRLKR